MYDAMRGFTLIEILIVVGSLAIIAVFSVPFLQISQVSSDLHTHTNTLVKTLRRAQQSAVQGQHAAHWGVYFDSAADQFIFYQGQDFAGRVQDFDLAFEYPEIFDITTDFGDEISFSLYGGVPTASGTISFSSANNELNTILINSYGRVQLGN